MKEYAPNIQSSELSLVDVPTTSADAAPSTDAGSTPAGTDSERQRVSPAASEDRFLARARDEHAAGHVDPPLWARAVAQAGGDKAQATPIYLASRATALRVAKRQERAARRARVVEVLSNAPETGFGTQVSEAPGTRDETTSKEPGRRTRRGSAKPNRWRVIVAAGTVACVAMVSGSIALWSASGPTQQHNLAKPTPPVNVSGRPMPSGGAASAAANTSGSAGENVSGEDFIGRLQALEEAGNWNLLVLYAVEWTRKQPGNANAWRTLSRGYVKLRQFGEALDAATKAVQLAPEDFLAWRNLGQLHVALQRPAEALPAFQKAAALNDRDVVSLVQEGILNTQLGRLPDARVAFDKALAVSAEDVPALCGSAALAQKEGRVKDAEAITRQVSSLGGRCPDPSAGESVRVAASDPAQSRPKSPSVRRPR
jgi:tetratricopeptide (TPR) repeat protein